MEQLYKEKFTEEQIQFSRNFPPDSINCQVWYWAGERFYAGYRYKDALDYATKALPLCEGTDMEANCLNLLSLCCFRLSRYEQAAEFAKRCYKLDEKTGDMDLMSSSLNTIAGIYLGANQPKEGEKYILKAIELAKNMGNQPRMAVLYGMASEIYHAKGDDTKALEFIDMSYNIENQLCRQDRMMVRLAQKSSVLLGLHNYTQAEEVLGEIIPFFRQTGDRHSLAISCNKMGMALLSQERHAEAVNYYREAAGIFLEIGDMRNEMHSRKGLYESLWSMEPDSAKAELERFNNLKDSLYNNTTAESLAKYNAEFGSDWLKIENERQKTVAKRITVVALILILTVAMGIWGFMKRRMRIHDDALRTVIKKLRNNTDNSPAGNIQPVSRKEFPSGKQVSCGEFANSGKQEYSGETAHSEEQASRGEFAHSGELDYSGETAHSEELDYSGKQVSRGNTATSSGIEGKILSQTEKYFIEQLVNYITGNMTEGDISVEHLSSMMCITRGQLNRRVKSLTGVTTQQYISRVRMEYARILLENNPELSIYDVSCKCGFEDATSFSRAFRRTLNTSPMQCKNKTGE